MSNQYPQQPYGQYPQQPYGPPPFQPQPPKKKTSAGKIAGLGCLGIVGLFVLIAAIAGVTSGNDSNSGKSSAAKPAATQNDKPRRNGETKVEVPAEPKPETPEPKPKKKTVTFKVWGTAPAGALGPLDITYGSDSDNRKGAWKNGKFTAELPLDDDALYYTLMAQLQGSGDIHCSVTVDGHTEKAHASGGYNICHAQANSGLLGGWN